MGLAYLYAGRGRSSTEGGHFPAPVVGAFTNLGAQRPGGPACPAGVPISPEKWGERGPGLRPWTPVFHSRSFPLAGFCGGYLCNGRGAISSVMQKPILDAFSRENMLESIFAKESPKSGHVHGRRTSPTTVSLRPTTPKRASVNERALKKGVQGAPPPALFPPAFSGESRAPARSRAGTHVAGLDLRWF